jgi:hypothetical protein
MQLRSLLALSFTLLGMLGETISLCVLFPPLPPTLEWM